MTRLITTSHGSHREAFTPLDWGLFVSIGGIWGSSFLFMAIGLDSFHPGLVTLVRIFAGTIFMIVAARRFPVVVEAEDRPRLVLAALLWVGLPMTMIPIAQQWIDSAVAGMLNGAVPIFTAIFATMLLKTLPGRNQMVGLVVGLSGVVAIAAPAAGEGSSAAIGVVLMVLVAIFYAITWNLLVPLTQRYGSIPVMVRILGAGLLMVIPFGIYGLGRSQFSWPSLLATVAAGLLGTGVAFILSGNLTRRVGATRSAFVTYLIPVIALILGVVFRDEQVSPLSIAGIGLVIAGAVLASRRETAGSTSQASAVVASGHDAA
ncbi:MAG: DMT family transporter [Actinobacteria bacterium]|nr:DMT family transporter [Actinomycetota bacterium]